MIDWKGVAASAVGNSIGVLFAERYKSESKYSLDGSAAQFKGLNGTPLQPNFPSTSTASEGVLADYSLSVDRFRLHTRKSDSDLAIDQLIRKSVSPENHNAITEAISKTKGSDTPDYDDNERLAALRIAGKLSFSS
jgi:hypothetical protein